MKRLSAFIILIIYFITTTGATVQFHYCMGKFAGWSLAGKTEKKCGKCGMKQKPDADNGCCKDEHKLVKIADDQKVDHLSFEISKIAAAATFVGEYHLDTPFSRATEFLPKSNAPPRSCHTSLHIINCVFLI